MTKVKDIFDFIQDFAPLSLAMPGDNCGILVGSGEKNVKKAVASLDVTLEVIDEAVAMGAELIISHHPVIFNPLKKIDSDSVVYKLIQNDLSVISMHTNLDLAPENGVNITLGKALGLKNIQPVEGHCLLTGELQNALSDEEFAKLVKEKLNCGGVRFTKSNRQIKRVAVGCGAAGEYVFHCQKLGADAFVTGELKHHEIIEANRIGITAVAAGHYNTEDVVIEPLVKLLCSRFPDTEFVKSKVFNDNIHYI